MIDRLIALGAFLLASAPAIAQASDPIDACVNATRVGQEQQRAGKLRAARATFVTCDEETCPVEVRSVCERLLIAAEASQPSIVLSARDEAGRDLADVDVSVDGAPIAGALDGKAMDVDPGPHEVRFAARDGRVESVRVVAHEGEKNRAVQAIFHAPRSDAPSNDASQTPEKTPDRRSPVPVLSYVLGAVGVVALGTFTVLAVDGQRRFDDCHDHGCAPSTIDGLSLERDIAWSALGVGVVALGAATVLFVVRPSSTGKVSVGIRGASLFFARSF